MNYLIANINKKILITAILSVAVCCLIIVFSGQRAGALSGSSFNPGRIIDDGIFYNGSSMSAEQIQAFLNAKSSNCDTNGVGSHSYYFNPNTGEVNNWNQTSDGDVWLTTTRAVYGARVADYGGEWRGSRAPYTCLSGYTQTTTNIAPESGICNGYTGTSNENVGQILYKIAQSCGINPQVMIVLLQKEQSLVTDTWPWGIQYMKATGVSCPDSYPASWAPYNCDPDYLGFFKQMYYGAHRFKRYKANATNYSYRAGRNNTIYWHPNTACGTSTVYIDNQATAALYIYTPYRPNQAALDNLYGTGDGCSSYGNRNFWRMFNDWFGSTISSDNYWNLVRDPSNGMVYVATEFSVHYVPNPQTLSDWGLNTTPITDVTHQFISSRTLGSPVNRLLRDKFGNHFLIDAGTRHYIRDSRYLQLWNLDINSAITVHGLSYYIPDGEWLGHCGKSLANPSNVWIINAINKYSATPLQQSAWGCNSAGLTTLSDNFLGNYPSAGSANFYALNNGTPFVVNQGLLWTNNDHSIVNYYKPSGDGYINLDSRLRQIFDWRNITPFAKDTISQEWFFIQNGAKHYIENSKLAELWNISGQGGLSSLSTDLLGKLTTGPNLTSLARTASPNLYYIMGSTKKHYLPDQTAVAEWSKPNTNVNLFTNDVLNRYQDGAPISRTTGRSNSGAIFLAQKGKRFELWHPNLVDAWGGSQSVDVNNKLYEYLDSAGAAWFIAKEGTNYYHLDKGVKHVVPQSLAHSWGLANSIDILPQTLLRFNQSGSGAKPFISLGGKVYSLSSFRKTELTQAAASLIPASELVNLTGDYFPSNSLATYLLRSSDLSDARLWLVAANGKILFTHLAQALNHGYISKSIELTIMSPEAISAIPTSPSTASLLIQSPSGGLKLLTFGEALSLPNSFTAEGYINVTGSVSPVSQEIFNSFVVNRTATRLIRDDSGKVYWIDNGQKRWITNGAHLTTTFKGVAQTYLHSTVISIIPDGPLLQ
ncbi:MAG: hypothetical protein M3Q14_03535 [bacterium]|nr:hypothetical protein [bacterium]